MNAEQMHKTHGNLYEIFSMTSPFTVKALKKSFRKLALKYHPDKNTISQAAQAATMFIKIRTIFNFLLISENRENYDEYLSFLEERKAQMTEMDVKRKFFAEKLIKQEREANLKSRHVI